MSGEEALGLRRGEVIVVPYDLRWPQLFAESAAELVGKLGAGIIDVHHVGSTSVPGLCAKPVLDILVSVANMEAALLLVPRLESLGYEFKPKEETRDRHYFRRPRGGLLRTHHLSLAEPNSKTYAETIAFRDALRFDPRLAHDYARLKVSLAAQFSRDRSSYTDAKTAFVKKVLATRGMT